MTQPVEDYLQKANQFLSVASQFNLGELSTEKPHPLKQYLPEQPGAPGELLKTVLL
jgi:hypothetical protein